MDESSIIDHTSPASPDAKLTFSPNFATPQLEHRSFTYFPNTRIDWFKLVGELQGCTEQVIELSNSLADVQTGPLSRPKAKQFSILEALSAEYVLQRNAFPEARPSDQCRGVHSKVCEKGGFGWRAFLVASISVGVLKSAIYGAVFSEQGMVIGKALSIACIAEASAYGVFALHHVDKARRYTTYIVQRLLEQSARLAVSMPKLLVSECGHSKFLKPQIPIPWVLLGSVGFVLVLLCLTVLFAVAGTGGLMPVLGIGSALQMKIFLGVGMVLSSITAPLFYFAAKQGAQCLSLMRKSLCGNLRGFLLASNYGLDYSEIHQLDEGVSYFFGDEAPTVFVPYIAIRDAYVHLEPYSVRFQYNFNSQELMRLDAKNDVRARQVLKRKFDQEVLEDVLVYVVFVLETGLKIWVPLSPTQLQSPNVADSVLFGFLGQELAQVCGMAAAALLEEDEDKGSGTMQEISSFCIEYQRMRCQSIAEEALHLDCLDRVFIPGCAE
ncbi:Transmembrane domain-containing protein [Spironucleus salmonicida]|uniref:Transmembrane domain-containing protein n=1 Tax=Spironucleus salmonicida TaxID=348837 RepID=A0A9P8RWK6_9EUKA|nr:Transmembrane domain-containing protein [Spironucleus salmonicida]